MIDSHWNYSYTGSENHPIYKNIDPNQLANNVHIDEIKEVVKVVLFPDHVQKRIYYEYVNRTSYTYL